MKLKISDINKTNNLIIDEEEEETIRLLEYSNRFFLVYGIDGEEVYASDDFLTKNELIKAVEKEMNRKRTEKRRKK